MDPFPSDQVPVPADQSLGLDEAPSATAPFKEPTQDGDLMTEHDYFDRQILAVMSTEAE
jgi:hypothetical protein